jgi:hypothetical protein
MAGIASSSGQQNFVAMAKDHYKREAQELLDLGYSHQQAFDQLVLRHPEVKPRRIANWLRHRPSLAAKQRYKSLWQVLLGLIVLAVLVQVGRSWSAVHADLPHWWRFFKLVPLATLFLAWGIYNWEGPHFEWVGWMNILGAVGVLRSLSRFANGGSLSLAEVSAVLFLAIGGLALYVHSKAFPKYSFVKDPMGGPGRPVFHDRSETR